MTLCMGLAGANTIDRFSLVGATRALTQLFSYEAPFLLALLGPAIVAGTWQISEVNSCAGSHWWIVLTQPIGFLVALVGLMGKLELPPFDSPEAETEIVAGPMTEYSGRGWALFRIGRDVELFVGLTLIAAFYLGGHREPARVRAEDRRPAGGDRRPAGAVLPPAHRPDGRPVVAAGHPARARRSCWCWRSSSSWRLAAGSCQAVGGGRWSLARQPLVPSPGD